MRILCSISIYSLLTRLLCVDLVLEYVEGGDLLDYILSHNGLSEPMAQHITHQMCSALSVRFVSPQIPYAILRTLTSHAHSTFTPKT